MTKRHDLTGHDAIRLLCHAVQKVHHFEIEQEGYSPPCKDHGELMLQNALHYLSYGDTLAAREIMDIYDEWVETGDAPWPYDSSKPPPGED